MLEDDVPPPLVRADSIEFPEVLPYIPRPADRTLLRYYSFFLLIAIFVAVHEHCEGDCCGGSQPSGPVITLGSLLCDFHANMSYV
jgi:hypothetical protein